MGKFEELGFVLALVDCGRKSITQLELSARKTKRLSRVNEAFTAAKEVINRWGGDVARLGEVAYAYCAFATFVDRCSSCFKQSLASGVCLSHANKRNPNYG